MGFLEQLKRQADALKAQQTTDIAALARNTAQAETACRAALTYFMMLSSQLEVLRPVSPAHFWLDRRTGFEGLRMSDFRVDSRRRQLRNEEVFDHVVMRWQVRSGQTLELVKDFPPDIEKLESRLRQSGAKFDSQEVRNATDGKLQRMHYTLVADFFASVLVTPQHDTGGVRFQLQNLDGFESVSVEFPGFEVGDARLDELARWLVGEPHQFLKDGSNLRRKPA